MDAQLKAAAAKGYKVYIMGHLPPVVASFTKEALWQPRHAIRYWTLVSQHGRVIAAQLFGQQHRDEFRVQMAKSLAGLPPLYMFASLSPIEHTNPAFYRLDVNSDYSLQDVHSYWANLSQADPHFRPGYSARDDYGLAALTNARYAMLARSFANGNDLLWDKFLESSVVQSLGGACDVEQGLNPTACGECNGSCRHLAVCTLLYGVSESSIESCLSDSLWKVAAKPWVWYADLRVVAVCLVIFIALSVFQWRRRVQQQRSRSLPRRSRTQEVELRDTGTAA
ncbi:SMPDL3B [Symbiodinium pilosum]|uniref:SMPDL3B protein n=1 Tax=Symbiodinium pilosum TaxID=2952 RepID=A0A812T928_SYMPI|nr:SMPDL3B [Symbiodinium pilosum]